MHPRSSTVGFTSRHLPLLWVLQRSQYSWRMGVVMRVTRCLNRLAVGAAIAAVATLGAASFAQADGMARRGKVAYERPFLWSGFYIGGHLGWGWQRDDNRLEDIDNYNGPGSSFRYEGADGAFGGVQLGYNWQLHKLVVGIEGELGLAAITAEGQFPPFVGVRQPTDSNASIDIDRYATIAGRLGVLAGDRLLIYGKAGWGWVHANASFIDADPTGILLVSGTGRSRTLDGLVWGGGIEYALSHTFSLKVEYLHFDIDDTIRHTATSTGAPANPRFAHHIGDIDTVKVGFNIKFDADRHVAPVK